MINSGDIDDFYLAVNIMRSSLMSDKDIDQFIHENIDLGRYYYHFNDSKSEFGRGTIRWGSLPYIRDPKNFVN